VAELRRSQDEPPRPAAPDSEDGRAYERAAGLAQAGDLKEAGRLLEALATRVGGGALLALVENDLAALAAMAGDGGRARRHLERALECDPNCGAALENFEALGMGAATGPTAGWGPPSRGPEAAPVRVAIVSLLFNWPSTGGGTVHTAEAGEFLARAGYEVRHFYAKYPGWEVGVVTERTHVPSEAIEFDRESWDARGIQRRFREAVDRFRPDFVVVTDSWNFKPLLAEALRHYRYFLRIAALECLCPLNNVRLLVDADGRASACPKHQFATPDACRRCVQENAHRSGSLHRAERELAGYGTVEYDSGLRRAFAEAEGVLVVNPLVAAMLGPYSRSVHVIPSGFDPGRFPRPAGGARPREVPGRPTRIFFAGLVAEYMKGFSVLHDACRELWGRRRDFELIATEDPPGQVDAFTRYIGWQSQSDLPRRLGEADIVAFPTVAEEALGRSAVEAMGAGRPVVASRIGGLQFTVVDGATGLLFEPGDARDLAAKLEALLDDPALRGRLGDAGRVRFEEHFDWGVVIEKHYRPLLAPRLREEPPAYRPFIPDFVDEGEILGQLARLLDATEPELRPVLREYRGIHEAEGYAGRLGEFKTLAFEEAFAIYALLLRLRPATVVEVGTQEGRSTRRIVDMRRKLGQAGRVRCYDPVDSLRFVNHDEVDFSREDLTGRFREEVLDRHGTGLIFLDAHPYPLLREVISEAMNHPGGWTLAVHDCSKGLCNPRMLLAREDPGVTSLTGTWERHVLAELFGVADPLSDRLDAAETATHRLQVLGTRHGLAVIMPRVPAAALPAPPR